MKISSHTIKTTFHYCVSARQPLDSRLIPVYAWMCVAFQMRHTLFHRRWCCRVMLFVENYMHAMVDRYCKTSVMIAVHDIDNEDHRIDAEKDFALRTTQSIPPPSLLRERNIRLICVCMPFAGVRHPKWNYLNRSMRQSPSNIFCAFVNFQCHTTNDLYRLVILSSIVEYRTHRKSGFLEKNHKMCQSIGTLWCQLFTMFWKRSPLETKSRQYNACPFLLQPDA